MKKKVLSFLTAINVLCILFLSCSCESTSNEVKIINAENMQGIEFNNDTSKISSTTKKNIETTVNSIPEETAVTIHTESSSIPVLDETEITTQTTDKTTKQATQTTTATSTETTTTKQTTTTESTSKTTTAEAITTSKTTTTTQTTTTPTSTQSSVDTSNKTISNYKPLNYNEVKGVWISYIELSAILRGKSETEFKKGFSEMMENCSDLGINTVYVHLRPFGDALYKSELYPWSSYVTGAIGTAPSFDPLKIMLEEAHTRKISFHGWINPMRASADKDISSVSTRFLTGNWYNSDLKGKYIVKNGDYWYLNPAYDDVIKLVADGAYEIVSKYDVDGLHIDDYFYPTTDSAFDNDAYSKSGYNSLSDFRLSRSSVLVKSIYKSVKEANPNVLFGISPQGSIENNYNYVYADVKTWCTGGYCDYIAPQIYYGFDNPAQPYEKCLDTWYKISSVKVIPGLALYKIGVDDTWAGNARNEWINNNDIIKRQIEFAKEYAEYNGIIFYSYNYLFNSDYVTDAHLTEIEAVKPIL